ncbi:hypothetical protein OIB37_14360 [Streptomyces sp. NBC_00820]|uniref:hypothetical protein n=1 Tax=Streptomyces sp. NBC_00820 TaxID=2975842 RepID=UPI002ED18ACE|nr:hypothetical protein OIB37_14360 [Streptomyces sp. NBC_00820]
MIDADRGVVGAGVLRGMRAVVALAAVGVLTAAAGGDRSGGYAQGHALARTGNEIGFDHARVGDEYWASLPCATNDSGEPLTILRTRVLQVPAGLKVVRYGVLTAEETGGHGFVLSGDEALRRAGEPRPRPERPVPVSRHALAKTCSLVRVRVTGHVRDTLSGYRVWYRQGAVEYRQDLDWDIELRLATDPGEESG